MSQVKNTKDPLKSARKTFKHWFKVLLTTNMMDNHQDRTDFIDALDALKKLKKKGE